MGEPESQSLSDVKSISEVGSVSEHIFIDLPFDRQENSSLIDKSRIKMQNYEYTVNEDVAVSIEDLDQPVQRVFNNVEVLQPPKLENRRNCCKDVKCLIW